MEDVINLDVIFYKGMTNRPWKNKSTKRAKIPTSLYGAEFTVMNLVTSDYRLIIP